MSDPQENSDPSLRISPSPAPRFVCEVCWRVLADSDPPPAACPGCANPAPSGGFRALGLLFKNRYRFVDQVGRGGQGAVFHAQDQAGADEHGHPLDVAVKVARLDLAEELRARLLERFRREMSATMKLSTEVRGEENRRYFVRCLASDLGRSPYLVLELVTWPTLRQLLTQQGGAMDSPEEVVDFGIELLTGVAIMHEHRMVHRDLKPENLFVTTEGGRFLVKIADFGIWTEPPINEGGHGGSLSRDLVGTPDFMSPEQQMSGSVGVRSDLHAVGSILWLVATGAPPYPWDRQSPFQDAFLRRAESLKTRPERPAEMPEELYDVLARALEYDVAHRHPDARTFARRLRELKKRWDDARDEAHRGLRQELDALIARVARARECARSVALVASELDALARRIAEARTHNAQGPAGLAALRSQVETLREETVRATRALDALFAPDTEPTITPTPRPAPEPSPPRATETPPPTETPPAPAPSPPPPLRWSRVVLVGTASGVLAASALLVPLRSCAPRPPAVSAPADAVPAEAPRRLDAVVAEVAPTFTDDPALNPWRPVPGQPFELHEHEVTRGEYARWLDAPEARARRVPWLDADASGRPAAGVSAALGEDARRLPVVWVDHEEATAYCRALRARLPTDAEWLAAFNVREWGDAAAFAPGERPQSVDDPTQDTTPSGVRGLLGNVMEWLYAADGAEVARHTSAAFDLAGNVRLQLAQSPTQARPRSRSAALGFRCLRPTR